MHNAPSVSYPVGRCAWGAWLAVAALLGGAVVTAAWAWQAPLGWRQVAGCVALVLAGGWSWLAWRRSATGLLAWDGQGWHWADGAGESGGRPSVTLDLQRWLLVLWEPEAGGRRWLWLERNREPQAWDALRRAVYSPARADAPPGAQPPAIP